MAFIQHSEPSAELDVELQFPGDRFPVIAGPGLLTTGWRGGLWVAYATGADDFTVEVSDGSLVSGAGTGAAGFILFQSEDYDLGPPIANGPGSPENWISKQFLSGRGGQNVATMVCGGTRAFFRVFETVGRFAPIVGVPIVYTLNEALFVSENGLLCNNAGMVGTPPAIAGAQIQVATVSAIPNAANNNRLCADVKY